MDAIDPAAWNQVVKISVPLLGLLLAGNLYFVLRLVNRIEKLDETVTGTFPVYNARLQAVEAAAKQLATDIREFTVIRERVAICEYALKVGKMITS
jgi:hypothetical protein